MYVVSDPVSERSGKIFVAENESGQGPGHDAENARNFLKNALSCNFVAPGRPCRGLSPGKGFASQRQRLHMACRDDKQYFKEITAGKS